MKRKHDSKGQNIVIGFFLGSLLINWLIAPWVWPIAVLMGTAAGFMIYLARQGHQVIAALIGIFSGAIGCAFTLRTGSVHSALTRENWSHVQMAPVLSLYSMALVLLGFAILVPVLRRQRNQSIRQK